MSTTEHLAQVLDEAVRTRTDIPKLTDTAPLNVAAAYAVQRAGIDLRIARGERLTGVKMGFTSKAKMTQMGVDDVIWGLLTDRMLIESSLDTATLIHPKIEPEIAFLIGRQVGCAAEADRAVEAVAVGFEVLDSRFRDFAFTLPDVIADNASASGYGVGTWHTPRQLANIGLTMEFDGRVVQTGSSAAILGDPYRSLRAAARLAEAAGVILEPGFVVLAGAATAALPLAPGTHVRVASSVLGTVEVSAR
jgi:2-oxo-3-hexenedioate decarboxylase